MKSIPLKHREDTKTYQGIFSPKVFFILFVALAIVYWRLSTSSHPPGSTFITKLTTCGPGSTALQGLDISKPCMPIRWLHIPKTGSSFLNTLAFWACPELPNTKVIDSLWGHTLDAQLIRKLPNFQTCLTNISKYFIPEEDGPNIDSKFEFVYRKKDSNDYYQLRDFIATRIHRPLPTSMTGDQLAHTVAFFRDPMERLLSHYMHSVKIWQENKHFSLQDQTGVDACRYLNGDNPRRLKFLSLYTAMLTGPYPKGYIGSGKRDKKSRRLTHKDALEACRRVKQMGFVGLTNKWEESICLFHAEWGGEVRSAELLNTRPNELMKSQTAAELTKEWPCKDDLDEFVYGCALERFQDLARKHPQCNNINL